MLKKGDELVPGFFGVMTTADGHEVGSFQFSSMEKAKSWIRSQKPQYERAGTKIVATRVELKQVPRKSIIPGD